MPTILAAAIGDCVHVAGVRNFLALTEQAGFVTCFLGARVAVTELVSKIRTSQPDIVGVSYRLSAGRCGQLLDELKSCLAEEELLDRVYLFGGTTATGEVARSSGLFEQIFDGTWVRDDIVSYVQRLAGLEGASRQTTVPEDTLLARIKAKSPLPVIRHHIGLSTLEDTLQAVRELAEANVLDVLSIGPDQTAQESFFRPWEQADKPSGTGGVPMRSPEDFERIYEATRRGNRPLCRCYSGTNDVLQWAEMLHRTIRNAWCAVPLTWYNQMDQRGPRPIAQSVREGQEVMRWHGERGVPVEVNEAHQWSLRSTSDATAVATAYLAAYNAKKMGVEHYVSQYMLNTPAGISATKDLAKMLAKIELIESLHDAAFHSVREARPGIASFPSDPDSARGQLAYSTVLCLLLRPDILHVVAYTEGQYAAGAQEIVGSVKLAQRIVEQHSAGSPLEHALGEDAVQRHKEWLKEQANYVLDGIRILGADLADPLTDPGNLVRAVEIGILDAPDLRGSRVARGEMSTAIVDGACVSIDPKTGVPLSEEVRVRSILDEEGVE